MTCKSMLTRLLFLMISIALATSVVADLALGPNPPLPPRIQMRKPENNPMQYIIAGILMSCAMMTSGYLIIRRFGFDCMDRQPHANPQPPTASPRLVDRHSNRIGAHVLCMD